MDLCLIHRSRSLLHIMFPACDLSFSFPGTLLGWTDLLIGKSPIDVGAVYPGLMKVWCKLEVRGAKQKQLNRDLQPPQLSEAAAITALGNVHWLFLLCAKVASFCRVPGLAASPAWFKHSFSFPFLRLQSCFDVHRQTSWSPCITEVLQTPDGSLSLRNAGATQTLTQGIISFDDDADSHGLL